MRNKVVQRKKAVFVGTFIEGISLIFTFTRLVFHVGGFFDGNNFGSFPPKTPKMEALVTRSPTVTRAFSIIICEWIECC